MSHQPRFAFSFGTIAAIAALVLAGLWVSAAESNGNRIVVPLSDPSRPATLKVHLVNGGITVKGYDGKEIIVEPRGHDRESPESEGSGGMRRIPQTATWLTVDSENNEVNIKTDALHQDVSLNITVPHHTSLSLSSINGGEITVSDVEGELDVNNTNGGVTLNNVSGSAVAHSLNGRVKATFTRVDPQKPLAFSSMNGNIDVTLPPDLKANLSLRTDNGAIYSDFNVQVQPALSLQAEENEQGAGGKYRVQAEKTLHATVNGGGPEIQIKNFNGNIYLRKGK